MDSLIQDSSRRNTIWGIENRNLTIGLLLVIVACAFESLAISTIMPAVSDQFQGMHLYGWAFSAFMLTNLIGLMVAGSEADRYGPSVPFIAGVVLFSVGLLVGGIAWNMQSFIIGRAIQGFGAGFIGSISYVVIGRGYSDDIRPRMLAFTSSAWVVPGLIGPYIAAQINEFASWRWVFLGLIPMVCLAAALAWPAMGRLNRSSQTARNWKPILLASRLAIGTGVFLFALGLLAPDQGLLPSLISERFQLPITIVLIAGAALVTWDALRRLLPVGSLRAAPGLPAAIATHGLINLAFMGSETLIPLGYTTVRGLSLQVVGIILTSSTIAWTLGSWIQAHFAQKGYRRRLSIIGLLCIALGIIGFVVSLTPIVPVWLIPALRIIAGIGMGMSYATNSVIVLEMAPQGQEGAVSSAMQVSSNLGVALGSGIGGAILALTAASGPQTGMNIFSLFALLITILGIFTASRLPAMRKTA